MEIFINAAASIDGKISNPSKDQINFSGEEDWMRVDRLRSESDAIMVGVETVLNDNPTLLPHKYDKKPTRIIADSKARIPPSSKLFEYKGDVVIAVGNSAPKNRKNDLKKKAIILETSTEKTNLNEVVEYLEKTDHTKLMVEGGGELNYSFLKENVIDKIIIYIAPKIIGGRSSPTLVDGDEELPKDINIKLESIQRLGEGVLLKWNIKNN